MQHIITTPDPASASELWPLLDTIAPCQRLYVWITRNCGERTGHIVAGVQAAIGCASLFAKPGNEAIDVQSPCGDRHYLRWVRSGEHWTPAPVTPAREAPWPTA